MKHIANYISHQINEDKEVKNPALRRALKKIGLEDVILIKGDGYFYISSDNPEVWKKISRLYSADIYVNSFNQQSIEDWVYDIKKLMDEAEKEYNDAYYK